MSKINTVLSGTMPSLGAPNSPLNWPAANFLVSFYRWQYRTYIPTLARSGTGPLVTHTGAIQPSSALVIKMTLGGALTTAKFQYSIDGGTNYNGSDITTAATVVVGSTGVTLAFPAGTYVLNETYTLVVYSWTDRGASGYDFISVDGAPGNTSKAPVPTPTAYGCALKFNGSTTLLVNATLGTAVAGGTAKAFYLIAKLSIDSLLSALQTIAWFGEGVSNNHAISWNISSANLNAMFSQMNSGSNRNFSGGTPPTGGQHIMECYCDGATGYITIDGTQVATGAIYSGALTAPVATLGKSYNSGAEGNPAAISFYNLNCYGGLPDATQRAQIRALMADF